MDKREKYLKLLNNKMSYGEAIATLKNYGADQMDTVVVIKKIFKLSLRKADELVRDSKHWCDYNEGNDYIKDQWFKKE